MKSDLAYSFDLDLPIECDDEYWENSNPEECFKQPAGQPSTIEFFNRYLSLTDILAYTIRTIVGQVIVWQFSLLIAFPSILSNGRNIALA
jgi:hypothetical protein